MSLLEERLKALSDAVNRAAQSARLTGPVGPVAKIMRRTGAVEPAFRGDAWEWSWALQNGDRKFENCRARAEVRMRPEVVEYPDGSRKIEEVRFATFVHAWLSNAPSDDDIVKIGETDPFPLAELPEDSIVAQLVAHLERARAKALDVTLPNLEARHQNPDRRRQNLQRQNEYVEGRMRELDIKSRS